jgi:hypothetical protein
MRENDLRKYKEVYKNSTVSDAVIQQNWESLRGILPERKNHQHTGFYRAAFVFAGLLLFISAGTVGAAQTARPGDMLYPVKVLSDTVISKVTGKPHAILEKRVDELIDESNNIHGDQSIERIEKAADEFNKTLENTKQDVKGLRTDKQEAYDTIASQESKLKLLIPVNRQVEKIIEKAIEKTEKTKEEVTDTNSSEQEKENKEQGTDHKNVNSTNEVQTAPEEKGNRK